ncbi:integrase core domain-containing protein [Streptomyces prasinus]|uniref:integrase core domain-containing protein n=1 Tax=Streptomyces prasinus TaxID=67345 RepID=UPI0036AE446C
MQQARNLAADPGMHMESLRFLLRDRDGKYGAAFDAVFEAEQLGVILSAPRVPRMNAHCERIIGSIRREALNHVLIVGEAHARHVLAAYQRHYNAHRLTRPDSNYPLRSGSSPTSQCTTSTPAKCCGPGSWAA